MIGNWILNCFPLKQSQWGYFSKNHLRKLKGDGWLTKDNLKPDFILIMLWEMLNSFLLVVRLWTKSLPGPPSLFSSLWFFHHLLVLKLLMCYQEILHILFPLSEFNMLHSETHVSVNNFLYTISSIARQWERFGVQQHSFCLN